MAHLKFAGRHAEPEHRKAALIERQGEISDRSHLACAVGNDDVGQYEVHAEQE